MPWKIDGQSNDNFLRQRDVQTQRLQNVHYVQSGNPDGLPVVFLHDNLTSSRWWEAAQEQLPYRYSSFAPDLRGYGATEYKPVTSLADFADDLYDFIKTIELRPFFLVGWGMGGGIAMQYALQHPETLVAVCLVNSISPKGHRPGDRTEHLDELTRALRANNQNEVAAYLRRHYFLGGNFPVGDLGDAHGPGSGPNADDTAFNYIMAGSMQARNYDYQQQEGIFHVMRTFDIHTQVASLAMPVFIINTLNSQIIRDDERKEVSRYLASDTAVRDELTIPGCGHSPMVERPDLFMQGLAGYLGRLNFQSVVHPSVTRQAIAMAQMDQASQNQDEYGAQNKLSNAAYENNNS